MVFCVCHSVAFALPCAAFVPKRNLPQELHPHISVDIAAVWDDCRADKITSHTIRSPTIICSPTRPPELQYEHYTLEDPAKKLPLDIFEAQPCIGKRIACLNIQIEPEDKVSFLITGNTWSFRQRLDAFGVALGYTGEDQARKYYRLLQSQDMANEEHRKRVLAPWKIVEP